MDLSKLPKLSDTPRPAEAPRPVERDDHPPRRRDDYDPEGLGYFDVFVSVGIGLLFLFLGSGYGKYLFGVGDPYPAITGTGIFWKEGSPKAGQEVKPDELEESHKKAYVARVQGRTAGIISESSLFFLGAALVASGLLGVATRAAVVPLRVRQAIAGVAFVAVAAAVLYALWATVAMMRLDITPLMTLVAILVGGMTLFMQAGVFQYLRALEAGDAPAHGPRSGGGRAAGSYSGGPSGNRSAAAYDAGASYNKPRPVHDRFAQHALRRQVLDDPARVVGVLQGPAARRFLLDLWEAARQSLGVPHADAPPDGLESEMTQVGPYSAAVVTLPTPQRPGEAHFVGVVLRSYQREDGAVVQRQPLVLYYTLEHAGGGVAAALCEWQAGDHVRFSDAVDTTYAAFRDAMWRRVRARQAAEDQAATPR